MLPRVKSFACLVAVALVVAGCGGGDSDSNGGSGGQDTSPVKVAVLEPFSGPFGYFGDFLKNSLQYEADRINASGGLLGRQVQVITRDDQIQAQAAVAGARELSDDPSVALVVGPSFTFLYNAVRPIYQEKKQLNCPMSVDATDAVRGAEYTFRSGPFNTLSNTALLKYFQDSGTVKTIGLVYTNDGTGKSIDAELKESAPKYGLKYLGAQFYNTGAANQLPQFNALKDADAIYINSNGAEAAQSGITAEQIKYQGVLVGNDGLQSYAFVDGAGERAAGSIFASEPLYHMTDTPQSEWPDAYRTFLDKATASYGVQTGPKSGVTQLKATPLATSCVVAWAQAVRKANSFDATKVAKAWETMTLEAKDNPAGIPVTFTSDNHDFFRDVDQMAVYQWVHEGGKWHLKTLVAPKK